MVALFVCKCLNITLEHDKVEENFNFGTLELTPTEQRDRFFSEKLVSCSLRGLKKQTAQNDLVGQRTVGHWVLHSCLGCEQTTHAVTKDKGGIVLICKTLQTTQEQVNSLKKSKNFSPVFNLLVPEVTLLNENVDTSNMMSDEKRGWSGHQVSGSLSKQLQQTLQSQLEAVEETVRQFRDQKYAEYEAYRERAHRDHKILASIISKARSIAEKAELNADNGPPSPQLPPLQRRRLSSLKDAKKSINIIKAQRQVVPSEEDSLEAEDIFCLEGTDSQNNMISDQDDYEDSDQNSEDERMSGMPARPRGGGAALDMARSLPINMPKFPNDRPHLRELDDDEEPHDIAASIKALAQSVHGDQFELPRPRFSTQI